MEQYQEGFKKEVISKIPPFQSIIYDTLQVEHNSETNNFIIEFHWELSLTDNPIYTVHSIYEVNKKSTSEFSLLFDWIKYPFDHQYYVHNNKIRLLPYKGIEYGDFNFDGITDFKFRSPWSGAHENLCTFWIYDAQLKKYRKNSFLSENSNIQFNPETKQVISLYRYSIDEFYTTYFVWDKEKLKKVKKNCCG